MSLWTWITEAEGVGQEAYTGMPGVGVDRRLVVELREYHPWELVEVVGEDYLGTAHLAGEPLLCQVHGDSLVDVALKLEPVLLKKFPELQVVFYPELRKTSLERILSDDDPYGGL